LKLIDDNFQSSPTSDYAEILSTLDMKLAHVPCNTRYC